MFYLDISNITRKKRTLNENEGHMQKRKMLMKVGGENGNK